MSLCPSESWAWRWRSCLACRVPGSTKCAGTWTAYNAGVMALSESFLCNSAHSGTYRFPWLGSYSVVQFLIHLMGQTFYCSAADPGVWGERAYGDGSTPYAWLNGIILLLCLPGFPLLAFPTTISSLTYPSSVSLQSITFLALGFLHNPLNSSSQTLHLPGYQRFCLGYVWLHQGLFNSHSI